MTGQNIRMMKEARALFWPWCAVTLVAVLHLMHLNFHLGASDLSDISIIGFFIGPPLLAALSFGNEFQHHTMPLLLAEPISRVQIWREKLVVMLIAVMSASLVYYAAWHSFLEQGLIQWFAIVAFLAM